MMGHELNLKTEFGIYRKQKLNVKQSLISITTNNIKNDINIYYNFGYFN